MKTSNKLITGLFLVAALIYTGVLMAVRMNLTPIEKIVSSGNTISDSRVIHPFTELIVDGDFEVELLEKESELVEVIADDNFQDMIVIEQTGNRLLIRDSNSKIPLQVKGEQIRIRVSRIGIEQLQVRGKADVWTDSLWQHAQAFKINTSGGASLRLPLAAPLLDVGINGASRIYLNGTANTIESRISGAGNLFAKELEAQDVQLNISGAAKAQVFAQKNLYANVSGAGVVYYKGNPVVIQHLNGVGRIQKMK